jgi:hypothetical protein
LTDSTISPTLKPLTYTYFISKSEVTQGFQSAVNSTKKLWRQHYLTSDQARYMAKEGRPALAVERPKVRKRVVTRLTREEETRRITHAYRMKGGAGDAD